MKLLTNFLKTQHPKKKFLYAITGGVYLGEMFVYIESDNSLNEHHFLSLPDMKIRTVSDDKFKFGLDNKIVDVVKKLPSDIYQTCKKQYFKNKTVVNSNS